MPNIEQLHAEAQKFRKLLDECDKKNNELLTEEFPVMNCKLSSLLLIYHLLTLWPDLELFGVNGIAVNDEGEETISHYWVEVGGIAIDLTLDQYNYIDDKELNSDIVQERPLQPIYVGQKNIILPYDLFCITYRDRYEFGLASLADDFIDSLQMGHSQLMKLASYT